jgi:hypothetical protein
MLEEELHEDVGVVARALQAAAAPADVPVVVYGDSLDALLREPEHAAWPGLERRHGDRVGALVEILDTDQEPPAGGPREQPRQHRRAQIADVQIGRRTGRESAGAGDGVHRKRMYDD